MGKCKDKLYYYFAEKNWGVRREYGPYVDAHQEEHAKTPWKHWWLLVRLNWHYRIMRRTNELVYHAPRTAVKPERHLPYLDGAESTLSGRRPEIFLAKDLLQYDVVSFDIFDTLILRPFAKPADLFMLVGKRLKRAEFYRIRTDAERRARENSMHRNGHTEVTIYDIYDIIEERTGIPKELGVQTELQVELDYCFANPYMKRVFRLLQEQEKPIIIVSDMYLPGEMMAELLKKCGYTDYEKLYVSCDYGCSKRSKSLYQYVKRDHDGKSIIHVGDNAASDIQSAKAVGLATYYYRSCHEIGAPYRADGMSELVGSAYAGIVNTHLHNGTEAYSPYYEYGFIYGGLYVLGFCSWIHRKAKQEGIDKILFLSRDGAIYQRVFNMMFDDVPNEYFLWSRIANTKYTLQKNREDFLRRLIYYRSLRPEAVISVDSLLNSMSLGILEPKLKDFGLTKETLIVPEAVNAVEQLFIQNWNLVIDAYADEKAIIDAYVRTKVGTAKKVAVIDVGWLGSGPMGIRYLIEDDLQMDCTVYCWQGAARPSVNQDILAELGDGSIEPYLFSRMYNRNNFDTHANTNRGLNSTFFEMFTQAEVPSYSGVGADGTFHFDIPEVENYVYIHAIHQGIMDFCRAYQVFGKDAYMLNISGYDAYLPFRMIIRDLRFFQKFFSELSFARGVSGNFKTQKIETVNDMLKQAGL